MQTEEQWVTISEGIQFIQLQAGDKLANNVNRVLLEFQQGVTTVESYEQLKQALNEYNDLRRRYQTLEITPGDNTENLAPLKQF